MGNLFIFRGLTCNLFPMYARCAPPPLDAVSDNVGAWILWIGNHLNEFVSNNGGRSDGIGPFIGMYA